MDARSISFDLTTQADATRRNVPRVPARMEAKLRDRVGNKSDVAILDLSVTGFRADAHYGFDPGHFVWLTIPGMQGLEAIVRWREKTIIGASFRQPLYPAVLDHVVRTITR